MIDSINWYGIFIAEICKAPKNWFHSHRIEINNTVETICQTERVRIGTTDAEMSKPQ